MVDTLFDERKLDEMEEEGMIVWEAGSEEDPDGFHMFITIYEQHQKLSTFDRLADALYITPIDLPSRMKPRCITYEGGN
jgi:hypothetical protein